MTLIVLNVNWFLTMAYNALHSDSLLLSHPVLVPCPSPICSSATSLSHGSLSPQARIYPLFFVLAVLSALRTICSNICLAGSFFLPKCLLDITYSRRHILTVYYYNLILLTSFTQHLFSFIFHGI